ETKARESDPRSRKFTAPGRALSRSTLTDFAWANLCSRANDPPARPKAVAVAVSTKANSTRHRKTRPGGSGEGGKWVLTEGPILPSGPARTSAPGPGVWPGRLAGDAPHGGRTPPGCARRAAPRRRPGCGPPAPR